tara:strand:- start:27677 stop:28915 length:1239 start_codon:yes stop_codon:yes gene_type:complete
MIASNKTAQGEFTSIVTIILCFFAAVLEGGDIVSMGLAAPSVAREFGFDPGELSYILTAAVIGLMFGAFIGGRLGDMFGRKWMLTGSIFFVGLFSLLTSISSDLIQFILFRLLCGVALGGAFPNLIALVSENAQDGKRAMSVGLMSAGLPVGGVAMSLFVAGQSEAFDWRTIFYLGGSIPLLYVPVLAFFIPESRIFRQAKEKRAEAQENASRPRIAFALFEEGRTLATLLLWTSFWFAQVVVYLINNWLPTLMVAKGFTQQQASTIFAYENLGAIAGCILLPLLADYGHLRKTLIISFSMVALSLVSLSVATSLFAVTLAAIVVGVFAIGGQILLYSLTPFYYPTLVRATGSGAAVSVGRLGGIAGPLVAGQLLAAGLSSEAVLIAAAPCALLAGAAATALVLLKKPGESA